MKTDNRFRPLELLHDFRFIPCAFPQDTPLPTPRERLERLKRLGYGGVALSPSYADYLSAESFVEMSEIIRYAKELGLLVWIYDEKFYPSGSAGGQIPRQDPRLEAKAVAVICGEPDERGVIYVNSPHGYGEALAAFVCRLNECGEPLFDTLEDISHSKNFGGGIVYDAHGVSMRAYVFFGKAVFEHCTTSDNTRGVRRYADMLSREAVAAFLDKTYGGYTSLGRLGDYVEAFFTDEPQIPGLCRQKYRPEYRDYVLANQNDVYKVTDIPDSSMTFTPYIPWTEGIEEAFCQRNGYSLKSALPRLFADESEEGNAVRADYWATVSELFEKNFGEQYADFARSVGVKYSGHFLYEEKLSFHPYMHGDLLAQLCRMDIPGCDMLFASTDRILEFASAIKMAASAAQYIGTEDVMIEASNVAKDVYPITKQAYQLATALEIALGATRFLSYYTDFCMPDEDMCACMTYCERILSRMADMKPNRPVYVYVPNRDVAQETFPSRSSSEKREQSPRQKTVLQFFRDIPAALSRHGMDYIFINDALLDTAELPANAVLVIPDGATVPKGAERFNRLIKGVSVEEAVSTLCRWGYSPVPQESGATLVTYHKYTAEREVLLLVNVGDDHVGEIKPQRQSNRDSIYCYDPHTDTTEPMRDLSCVKVPHGEARLLIWE